MFGEFSGLPVHALVVHAVVTVFVAKESGKVLKAALGEVAANDPNRAGSVCWQ